MVEFVAVELFDELSTVCKRSERCSRPFLRCNGAVNVCTSGCSGGVCGLVAAEGDGVRTRGQRVVGTAAVAAVAAMDEDAGEVAAA